MLDKKYDFKEKEIKWLKYWDDNKVYEFIPGEKKIFSIDTPPPTVSGKIHIGHIFSFSQAEMIARYKRLCGYNVFYPFGFDDNGLPSERLVEKEKDLKAHQIGREEFQKLCYETTNKYEEEFKKLFKRVGISANFDYAYKTVSPETMKISQISFLEMVDKGYAYHRESPALWCNECLTSIAQAELETKTVETTFNYIKFKTDDEEEFVIATTRPELLPAIVAVFVNPNDEKNNHLIGKKAIIPLINTSVMIRGDELVDASKGTGIVMCCTFGDQTDIEWWKKYNLPLKNIFTKYGKIVDSIPNYGGMKIKEARKKILEDLEKALFLVKTEPLTHEVMVHERCGKEIEYAVIKQWFIDTINHKDDFLKMGEKVNWYPDYMYNRYKEWVLNIAWDWCISRQRYFGVYFPVWYCKDCEKPKFAQVQQLPINPMKDAPIGSCECGCNEFIPEVDVMDTWATSSVTPLINMRYGSKDNFESILKPMSMRANAHDIIRTWDFYTIVKSFYHFGDIPWENLMISGFILASKGEKISKSKANSNMTPMNLIDEYSADVVRYWAANGRLGTDMVFTDETLLRGKKLVNKLWNVASFVNIHLTDYADSDEFNEYEYMDKWIIGKFQEMEEQYKKYLDMFEVGLALNTLEKFFWNFCDNYIEIVKHRLYRPEEFGDKSRYSGQKTVYVLLYKLLQDFSIFFPFITEELYQNIYEMGNSIHVTTYEDILGNYSDEIKYGDMISSIISRVRGEKTNNNASLKTEVKILSIDVEEKLKEALDSAYKDFRATLNIHDLFVKSIDIDSYIINKLELNLEKK